MPIEPSRRHRLGMSTATAVPPLPSIGGASAGNEPAAPGASSAPSQMLVLGSQRIAVYESKGSGPAVLLVHGNSASSQAWNKQLDGSIGRKYRIVAIDLPGHGQSPAAAAADRARTYSLPGYAAIIEEVAARLSLRQAVFVGWSLGGHAVLEASAGLTQAAGFMIFGTPPLPYPPAADFGGVYLKLGLGFVKDWTPDQAKEYVSDFFVPGATGVAPFFLQDALKTDGYARSSLAESVGTVGYADEVGIVTTLDRPLAIVQGAQEQIVDPAYLNALAPRASRLWLKQVQTVSGAGHAVQWEQADKFNALLDAFVASCQPV